jgi:pimeloyl-ACP methyl ester carboxylesterase
VPRANVGGVGINYDVVGDHGPWVLLIQGGRQDMELFRPLAEHFAAAGHRVIIHDRRNSGASDVALGGAASEEELFADDAFGLCAQLDALPVIACGGAGGSRHCILMTLRHPGSTRSLLLWWPSGSRPAAEQLAEQYYGQFITAAEAGGMPAVLATPYYAERCARVPDNRDRLLAIDPGEFIATMRRWRQFFLDGADLPVIGVDADTVRSITLPTCIVPGHDLIHPHHVAEGLAALLPNAELHELPPLERPDNEAARRQARLEHQRRLADVFLDFLQRHPEVSQP